ncbi:doublecortin domain-containing protein 2C [Diretmus argenteus]
MSGTGRAVKALKPPIKTVTVFRNGDAFFSGKRITVNHRQALTFDTMLTSLTRRIEAPFGAVRRLYTPRHGHRLRDLDDLQHGSSYVAAGGERFKRLNYCEINTKKPQKKKKKQILPVVHSTIVVPARRKRNVNESCTINVFTNGAILVPPARLLIPKYTLTSWENILAMVTEKVHLRTGAVYRLCTLDGHPLHGATELENNQYYVAVGAAKFRALPYDYCVPNRGVLREIDMVQGTSQDSRPTTRKTRDVKDVEQCLSCLHRRQSVSTPLNGTSGLEQSLKSELTALQSVILKLSQHTVFPLEASVDAELGIHSDEFAHTGFREDLEHTARGKMKKHTAKAERAEQQRQVSRIPLLLSTGDGSVFNAKNKRREVAGAAEVQEDRQLKADLPVDQVEAKVVEEEYEHEISCSADQYKASLCSSEGLWLQQTLSAGSRRDGKESQENTSGSPIPEMYGPCLLSQRYNLM